MRRLRRSILGFGILAAMSGIEAQAQAVQQQRVNAGLQQAGSAVASGVGRYHMMVGGTIPGGSIVSALFDDIVRTRPATVDEVRALMQKMKIDSGMPNRISMNVTVPKQTQGATFGERSAAGVRSNPAGGGAASAAYAATGRANAAQDIVIIFCNDPAEEQEAVRLFASTTAAGDEERQTQGTPKTRHDAVKTPINNIRRETAPGGRSWLLISEERGR